MNLLFLSLLVFMAGCGGWDSLRPGVERVCTKNICYLRGSPEQINRHCRKGAVKFDDGSEIHDGDGRMIRACIKRGRARKRFRIWVAEGYEHYIPHEMCHLEEMVSGRGDHGRCNQFGFGKEKKRL